MCEDCFDDEETPPTAFSLEEIAAAARHIERDMAGAPVPAGAWDIYFGRTSGVLDLRRLDRIARSVEAARVLLALSRPGGHSRAAV
ncbi:hypothetical protein [Ancylobacter radicis]|uniref:Uncharacterized protein n=1 Tax=Ancylobacter radicis TaxID=2836179 RepID=A0ABS5RDF4_9HYPH|nr:hypothetical protein [Ancylobacter radicis]MBS9478951.1 hypothetical protein [Ancylobacter radicis]